MQYSQFKVPGIGDHKMRSKSSKDLQTKTGKCQREQMLELFGPATKERFSPMHDGKCSSSNSSTSSSSSKTSKTETITSMSDKENKTKRNKKGYPYTNSFIVDMEKEPDYYGEHSNRAHKHKQKNRSNESSSIVPSKIKHLDSPNESHNPSEKDSKKEKNSEVNNIQTFSDKSSYPWKSPITNNASSDKGSSFKKKGMSLSSTRWRRWIFAAILVLIFFTMMCIILAYVLKQTTIYEEAINSLNIIKKKLDKCCFYVKNETTSNAAARNEQ